MKRILSLPFSFFTLFSVALTLQAQTYYVDALEGNDAYPGTVTAPFQSIKQAVTHANALTGEGEIRIKLLPGIYTLEDRIDIHPVRMLSDTQRYIIEAAILPNDPAWTPEKMPIIPANSPNNSITQFPHSTGFLIAAEHVSLQGIKFLGNANPAVDYYYPISKENPAISDLLVSQCIFIGDKEAAKIQGGIWAHGPNNTVSHCVFYGCRNAVLFFNNVAGFTVEHTIIYGSYESAFWLGTEDYSFTFKNNVIAHNTFFLVCPKDITYTSPFSHSVIAHNKGFVGYWSREAGKVVGLPDPNLHLREIMDSGVVNLYENQDVRLTKDHLHLTPDSEGVGLKAGIFWE